MLNIIMTNLTYILLTILFIYLIGKLSKYNITYLKMKYCVVITLLIISICFAVGMFLGNKERFKYDEYYELVIDYIENKSENERMCLPNEYSIAETSNYDCSRFTELKNVIKRKGYVYVKNICYRNINDRLYKTYNYLCDEKRKVYWNKIVALENRGMREEIFKETKRQISENNGRVINCEWRYKSILCAKRRKATIWSELLIYFNVVEEKIAMRNKPKDILIYLNYMRDINNNIKSERLKKTIEDYEKEIYSIEKKNK